MNQERRDFLKAMLLAPVAGLVPVTGAAAVPKPVAITLPEVKPYAIEYVCYTVTVRRFELTFPDAIARQSIDAFATLAGRTNTEPYRGFEPGELRIVNMQIYAKDKNRDARVEFELRQSNLETMLPHGISPTWFAEYERRNRCSFSSLPDGKFVELKPDFTRIGYATTQGHVIAESL